MEGVHYHYPTKYRSLVKTGEPFIYYRGVQRPGGKRGVAEYLGAGTIGAIWEDTDRAGKKGRAWYCAIENYARFNKPVPAKVEGQNLERIRRNLWRDGVRALAPDVYAEILRMAEITDMVSVASRDAQIKLSDALLVPRSITRSQVGSQESRSVERRSKRAKEIGDWAEQVVFRMVLDCCDGRTNHVHRAAIGETPGWDIDYIDANGERQLVEVKGTVAAAFTNVDLTINEFESAKRHGARYWLYLAARCLTGSPVVQVIQNPAAYLTNGEWTATPQSFLIEFGPPRK